jgi:signal transduction histidine kinase/ActR/RegA family two-component response regulator
MPRLLIILLLSLACCRNEARAVPVAVGGQLDLRGVSLVTEEIPLSGEWAFYPDVFLTDHFPERHDLLKAPAVWNGQRTTGGALGGFGAGTYRLRVLLPADRPPLALKMLTCSSACRVFLRFAQAGSASQTLQEVYKVGAPSLSASAEIPDYRPGVVRLPDPGESVDVVIHVSNFHHNRGGLWRSPVLGSEANLIRSRSVALYWDFFLCGALVIMAVYHAGLSFLRRANFSSLYLGLFCAMMAARTALTGEMSIVEAFPGMSWHWRLRFEYMNFNLGLAAFLAYCGEVFPAYFPVLLRRIAIGGCVVLALVPLALGPGLFTQSLLHAQIWLVFSMICMAYAVVRAARAQFADSRLFLTGFLVLSIAALNDLLYSRNLSPIPYITPPGLIVFIVIQGFELARRFVNAMSEVERLNDELEMRVVERTRDMEIEKERALDASQAKSQFLSVMAHEVRTPLNVILGNVHLLLEDNLPAEHRRVLESVQSSSQSLSLLLNEVLDLARIEAGKMLVQKSPLALRDQLEEIVNAFQARAAERGNAISLAVAADVPLIVSGDRIKLSQILTNLLSNAVKFTRSGKIDVTVESVSAAPLVLRFIVADTGIGIAPGRLEAIFEKFTQENAGVSSRYGGAGLGLAIVQGLTALLDGTIRAESHQGRGTRFIVELPFDPSDALPEQTVRQPATSLKGLRVLAAEDNPESMALLRRLLERWEAQIVEAVDGAEAVRLSAESEFDVILMDLNMPVMDGFEASRRITERERAAGRPAPRIIAFSAAAVPEIRERAYANGILEFLTKPVQPQELNAALARSRKPIQGSPEHRL